METKTKDGKYFSQLGSWSDLIRILFLFFVFKTLGLIAVFVAAVLLWGVPALWKKNSEKARSAQ